MAKIQQCRYRKKTNAICKSKKRLDGRTTIVTGGTSGIGLNIAIDFATRGARVIVACPFEDEGLQAEKLIIEKTGNRNVVFKLLDLSSLNSVREFANDIMKNENRLDILMNNAGVGIPADFLTKDGMNFIMHVNYYGHFLLTILLLPLLIKTGKPFDKSRIVNTTSISRHLSSFDVDNYDKTSYWFRIRIYSNSKMCLVLFSRELTKRIENCNVVVNNADPGCVATRIYDSCSSTIGFLLGFLVRIPLHLFFKNPFEGAQTGIHIALDEDAGLVSGEIFDNCELVTKELFKKQSSAFDVAAAKLWKRSIDLVQLKQHELNFLTP
ncbi:retinol dehydrogenase 11-like [Melitaea cinxia]|uniref:retinol dehydrogenase 11-like n=1 Tax=Melitaea cinxia TaxID=113334 RepID=UPI001E274A35|nr:retinol dehydrogenase 11-like [Melitaea cinxia]